MVALSPARNYGLEYRNCCESTRTGKFISSVPHAKQMLYFCLGEARVAFMHRYVTDAAQGWFWSYKDEPKRREAIRTVAGGGAVGAFATVHALQIQCLPIALEMARLPPRPRFSNEEFLRQRSQQQV